MIAQGGILALDLSSNTGWAYGLPGAERPLSGVWKLPAMAGSAAPAALVDKLDVTLQGMKPKLLIVEAPLPPQAQTHMNTARMQFGLATVAELVAYWRDVRVLEEKADVVRRAVLGTARFPKGTMKSVVMAWCNERGFEPADHNAADAILLWFHACQQAAKRKVADV